MKTFEDFRIEVPSGSSGEVYLPCPECSTQRKKKRAKCLSVNTDKGVWICHHCGWSGGLDTGSRRSDVAHWAKPDWRKPEPLVPHPKFPEGADKFWKSRGISAHTLERANVKTANAYVPMLEGHADCHVFPYYIPTADGKQLVNRKYRMVEDKSGQRMEGGARIVWYGLDRITEAETVVIVEGEPDALAVIESGTWAVVSVPHGAPTPDSKSYSSKFDFIPDCEEFTKHVQRWVIWVDNDPAGKRLEEELSRRLGVGMCSRVIPVDGCKDANDVLIQRGKGQVQASIEGARPWPVEGVHEIGDMFDRITALYEHGLPKGVATGWRDLDAFWSVKPGEFTVVTGIPNSGKSNFVDALCVNVSKANDWHVICCSPENQPLEDHMARICEKWAGIPFDDGPSPRMSLDELTDAQIAVNKRFSWLLPDSMNLPEILGKASALVRQKGSRILVLDPWNEMDHSFDKREDIYLAEQLRIIKQWARKHDCHVFIVAHPKTMGRDKDNNFLVPTPYDISGGSMWRNKADNCLTVWRDFTRDDGVIEVHVQKVRFRQVGKIGLAELRYMKATATYESHGQARPPLTEVPRHWTEENA